MESYAGIDRATEEHALCVVDEARQLGQAEGTDSHRLRVLHPHSDETRALRELTRTRKDLVGVRVRLANQLRAQLDGFGPGAARILLTVSASFTRRFAAQRSALFSSSPFLPPKRSTVKRVTGASGAAAKVVRIRAALESTKQTGPASGSSSNGVIALALPRTKAGGQAFPLNCIQVQGLLMWLWSMNSVWGRWRSFAATATSACWGAVSCLANSTRHHHPWARSVYTAARERGLDHLRVILVLGRARLRVLWRCWQDEVPMAGG